MFEFHMEWYAVSQAQDVANAMGAEGWNLVSATPEGAYVYLSFSRNVDPAATQPERVVENRVEKTSGRRNLKRSAD